MAGFRSFSFNTTPSTSSPFSNPSSTSSSPFSFSLSSSSSPSPATSFGFGAASSSAAPSTSSSAAPVTSFGFGPASSSAAPSISFGSSAAPSSSPFGASSTTPSTQFGAPTSSAATTTSPFGAPTSTPSTQFGAPNSANSSPLFGGFSLKPSTPTTLTSSPSTSFSLTPQPSSSTAAAASSSGFSFSNVASSTTTSTSTTPTSTAAASPLKPLFGGGAATLATSAAATTTPTPSFSVSSTSSAATSSVPSAFAGFSLNSSTVTAGSTSSSTTSSIPIPSFSLPTTKSTTPTTATTTSSTVTAATTAPATELGRQSVDPLVFGISLDGQIVCFRCPQAPDSLLRNPILADYVQMSKRGRHSVSGIDPPVFGGRRGGGRGNCHRSSINPPSSVDIEVDKPVGPSDLLESGGPSRVAVGNDAVMDSGDPFKGFSQLSIPYVGRNARSGEFIEVEKVPYPSSARHRLTCSPPIPEEIFVPKWDVFSSESLDHDIPREGGTLGHRMLKAFMLPAHHPQEEVFSPFAEASHHLAQANRFCMQGLELGIEYQREVHELRPKMKAVEKGLSETLGKLLIAETERDQAKGDLKTTLNELKSARESLAYLKSQVAQRDMDMKNLQDKINGMVSREKYDARLDEGWMLAKACVQHVTPDYPWDPAVEDAYERGVWKVPQSDNTIDDGRNKIA